jgi:protein-disulfide isomerase
MKTSNKIIEMDSKKQGSDSLSEEEKKKLIDKDKKSERTENIVAIAVFLFLILIGAFIFTQGFGLLNKERAGSTKLRMIIGDDPYTGNVNSSITIVAFSDYECPFCSKAEATIKSILTKYDGKVLYVFKDNPLAFMHPYAFNASLAAECAKEQDKYWEYHDYLFEHQEKLDSSSLRDYANTLGLDMEKFNLCFDTQRHKDEINQDLLAGEEAGVSGTPTFFIFNDNVRMIGLRETEAVIIVGAQPQADFDKAIDDFLKAKI